MTQANKLKELILSGGDADEIDARMWCYLEGEPFDDARIDHAGHHLMYWINTEDSFCKVIPQPTQSLDALKAVQDKELEGWTVALCSYMSAQVSGGIVWDAKIGKFSSPSLPTMHLAWLYAIVCAIEYVRG